MLKWLVDTMTEHSDFVGAGTALTAKAFGGACEALECTAAELWALLDVASGSCGFTRERRPALTFERQAFHRETDGSILDAPNISNRKPGGYGASGDAQYDRLRQAIDINRDAALRSANWGIGQLAGANFSRAGYDDVSSFVAGMMTSEDAQLAAMVNHLRRRGLHVHLRTQNWPELARGYFGSEYRHASYDLQLRAAYARYGVGLLPDFEIRELQLNLTYLGYNPGRADGLLGTWTHSAIADFQCETQIKPTGEPDRRSMAAARAALEQSAGLAAMASAAG
jgi:hypothetical protein